MEGIVRENLKAGEFRHITNRCMVSWIVALCVTVMVMLTISSVSRWPPPHQRTVASDSGIAGWLQAADAHVQSLAKDGLPGNRTTTTPPAPKPVNLANVTKPPLYPRPFRLSNLDRFTFVINNDVCGRAPVDLVMVVTSDTRRPSWRAAIRAALSSAVLEELRVRRVFLLAELAPPANTSVVYDRRVAALQAENHEHGDLVVGRFRDAYRNLTYKHLMGLHWATAYCPQARHIVKMDHDIVVDVFQLLRRLKEAPPGQLDSNILIGAVFAGTEPIRDPSNKWYVSREEYPEDRYPAYMSGWLYLVTPDAAARLVAAAAAQPFFWVDDAFVTGVVRERAAPDMKMLDFDRLWGYRNPVGWFYSPYTMQIACVYECAAEAQASVSHCTMLVGPVWENRLVMRMFYRHAEFCHRRGCSRGVLQPPVCAQGVGGDRERANMPEREEDIGDVS